MAFTLGQKRLGILAALLLGACATTTPGGRQQLTGPEPITALYSSVDLNLTLATLTPVLTPCSGVQCQVDKGFERQVSRLGARLAAEAYRIYPDLESRVPGFKFVVAEKSDGGSSSDAGGTIVIYRGVRKAAIDEEALGYLIASEMARVIARHHDERFTATVFSSVLAQLVLGPANLARGAAFLATSAASAFGRSVATKDLSGERTMENDAIVIGLLGSQGWSSADVADSLADYSARLGSTPWAGRVRDSAHRLANRGMGASAIAKLKSMPFALPDHGAPAGDAASEADQRSVMKFGDAEFRVGGDLAEG